MKKIILNLFFLLLSAPSHSALFCMDQKVTIQQNTIIKKKLDSVGDGSLKLSQDGSKLALYYQTLDKPIEVFDTNTGHSLITLHEHNTKTNNSQDMSGISNVFFSNDNKTLFSSSHNNTIKFWDLNKGLCVLTIHPTYSLNKIQLVSISPDGKKLAAVEYSKDNARIRDQILRIFNTQTGGVEFEKTLYNNLSLLDWSKDSYVAYIKETSYGQQEGQYRSMTYTIYKTADWSVISSRLQFDPRTPRLALKHNDGHLSLIYGFSGNEVCRFVHPEYFKKPNKIEYAFNHDSTKLVLKLEDGSVTIWDISFA